jgi:CheY-like chemotaxis protein
VDEREVLVSPAASRDDGDRPDVQTRSLRVSIVEYEFLSHCIRRGCSLGHIAVAVAVSADQAVAIAEREHPDVVLMDIRQLGSRDGIDAAEEINRRLGIGSIFVTANTDPQNLTPRRGRQTAWIPRKTAHRAALEAWAQQCVDN